MKSITLVARDMGGSEALGLLAEYLGSVGWQTHTFLGYGKQIASLNDLQGAVEGSDITLCGMSSSPELAAPELTAFDLAKATGKKFGFFADIFNSHRRTWLQDQLRQADVFFVLNEDEAAKARQHLPGVNVVVTGNPVWERFAFPKFTATEIRSQLGLNDGRVLLVVGTKELLINIALVSAVLNLVHRHNWHCQIVYSFHPGDRNPVALYEPLVAWSGGKIQLVLPETMAGTDIVPAADVIVDSFSTIGIQAGFLRKPVVTYASGLALGRLKVITGQEMWEPIEQGYVMSGRNDEELQRALLSVFSGNSGLRQKQEAMFLIPTELGRSVGLLAAELERLVP
ncbi:MAG: hypothetical protein HUU49_04450 [Candidatus Buchananbacteria bacterium]|nr:hypothetical protein [Candidatus Buchananbacteria bacterium]